MKGWVVTRKVVDHVKPDGTTVYAKRYDARWRIGPGKIKGKTFRTRKDADNHVTNMAQRVQEWS
jgi:hypothetical protein